MNLTRGLDLPAEPGAHVMKLPYTSLQHAIRHAEETETLVRGLGGMPVVCCSLHSQVVPVCAGIGEGIRTAYLQLPGGALPVSLSDAVRALKERGLIDVAVAVAACFDGDIHCVTTASALSWSKAAGFDAAVCAIGPGIVGTGTILGHGGLAAAEAANVASALGGQPVLAVRMSEADERKRHHDVSHHTKAVLEVFLGKELTIAPEEDGKLEEDCAGLPLSHMGRGLEEDRLFFAAAYSAGRVARDMIL